MSNRKRHVGEDYVPPSQTKEDEKDPPPQPWPIPHFKPVDGINWEEHGKPNLPEGFDNGRPDLLFDLLWTPEIIDLLVRCTNANRANNAPAKPDGWRDVTTREMHGYLGILLWASCWQVRDMEDLWNTRQSTPTHEAVGRCMPQNRWQAIDRWIHVTPPPPNREKWSPFQKISKLSALLQSNFAKCYTPGAHLAVDEAIQRFVGKSCAISDIPPKPTPSGYKVWILAHHGYILNWLWHHKGEKRGPIDLDKHWLEKGFSKTEVVVLTLISRLPNRGKGTVVYLNDLFTSTRLLRELRHMGIGACGTATASTTRGENHDAKCDAKSSEEGSQAGCTVPEHGSEISQVAQPFSESQAAECAAPQASESDQLISCAQDTRTPPSTQSTPDTQGSQPWAQPSQRSIASATSTQRRETAAQRRKCEDEARKALDHPGPKGLHLGLTEICRKRNEQLPRGQLFAHLSKCGEVIRFAWEDATTVFFMSTIHSGYGYVLREHKRPANAFGEDWERMVRIPDFIDDYNHYMHGADIADHFRSLFKVGMKCHRTWKPLFYFLLDVSVVNAFRLSHYCDPQMPHFRDHEKYLKFHTKLATQLMRRCEFPPQTKRTVLAKEVSPRAPDYHTPVRNRKRSGCRACQAAGRIEKGQGAKRRRVSELSDSNRTFRRHIDGHLYTECDLSPPDTTYGCSTCDINLCNARRCWEEHIEAVKERAWGSLQSDRLRNQSFLEEISTLDEKYGWDSQYEEHFQPIRSQGASECINVE